jgi:hypothetical protein
VRGINISVTTRARDDFTGGGVVRRAGHGGRIRCVALETLRGVDRRLVRMSRAQECEGRNGNCARESYYEQRTRGWLSHGLCGNWIISLRVNNIINKIGLCEK